VFRRSFLAAGAVALAAGLAIATPAVARDVHWSVSIGGPGYAISAGVPYYGYPAYAPAPVYVAPPVVYPAPVYVAPPVVYRPYRVYPSRYWVRDVYYGPRVIRHHGHRGHRW